MYILKKIKNQVKKPNNTDPIINLLKNLWVILSFWIQTREQPARITKPKNAPSNSVTQKLTIDNIMAEIIDIKITNLNFFINIFSDINDHPIQQQ